MKNFVFYLMAVSFYTTFCFAQNKHNTFVLRGKVIGRDTGNLVLNYNSIDGKSVMDTVSLRLGCFTFSGTISEPTRAALQGHSLLPFHANDPNLVYFFLEPSKMTISLEENDYAHAKISGSITQAENEILNSQLAPVLNQLLPLDKEYSKARTDYVKGDKSPETQLRIKDLYKQIKPLLDQSDNIYYTYVSSHPNSYVSANILDNMNLTELGGDSAIMYYNSLSTKIQNSFSGRNVYNKITSDLKARRASAKGGTAAVGSQSPDFAQKTASGSWIKLSSFKGKEYVLLDFWASWCPPCRAATPAIKEFYKQYNAAGLQIISISLDFTRDKWLAAIKADQISLWPQVFAGHFNVPGNFAKETFGILEIPQFILIDKTGKIIGRYTGLDDASSGTILADRFKALFP